MVLIGLFGTLYHANTNLKKQVARKERRSIGVLSWIICLMIGNVCLLYFVFQEEQLYYALIFMKVQVENWDIWALMWVIGVSDFALKFAAIAMKAVIAMLPNSLIPFKRRGKYYMIFEETSHFYRAFLPINPWMCFLGNRANDSAMSFVFSTVLAIAYCVFKGVRLLQKTREMTAALQKFLQKSSYGTTPTKEDFSQTGSSCPICQDEVHDPIMLACKHIFCEECVSMWFDRERTCPMCRANIIDDPKWRDGGTVGTMQLF
ncbi:PREDICTED: RING finger and transmembrane domain-containing protein 2-like [Priapulus caudatus]|uniref:RING finger and transmembrane domain-containing protein 2-like n=1 Tax=Priapulus caudatus TaxID=37621 RepID=A0ABM1EHM6_PRICU|nr:PREDICTED: RING finger and transmembrane domain-containing protein 2-like [Priapulus caudatus]